MENGVEIGKVVAKGVGRLEWMIPEFSALPRRADFYCTSPDFDADGRRWILRIFPNGTICDTKILRITVYERSPREEKSPCLCCHRETFGDVARFGYIFTRTRRELEDGDLLPDGQLTVKLIFPEANIKFSSSETQTDASDVIVRKDKLKICACSTCMEAIDASQMHSSCKRYLKFMAKKYEGYDVRIVVKGEQFRAHKDILIDCLFHVLLSVTHDSKEKKSNEISIEDCDECLFKFSVFEYDGEPVRNLTTSQAFHLYYAGDKYNFPDLKEQCVTFLKTSLSVASVCNIARLAAMHGEEELLRTATDFFAKNIEQIVLTVEWENFMAENPALADELYSKSLAKLGHVFGK